MPNVNRNLPYFALRLDPSTPNWLIKIMSGISLMKGARKVLSEHDEIMKHAIDNLTRCAERLSVIDKGSAEDADDAVID